MKDFYSISDLLELSIDTLPATAQGMIYYAKTNGFGSRKRVGQGGGLEYELASMPILLQAKIRARQCKINLPKKVEIEKVATYSPEYIWAMYENATTKQKEKAQYKCNLCLAVAALVDAGIKPTDAIIAVSNEHNCAEPSLRRWYYTANKFERNDYLPALLGKYDATTRRINKIAPMSDEAWDFFKADYLRNERPQLYFGQISAIECLLGRYKPAHIEFQFHYDNNEEK